MARETGSWKWAVGICCLFAGGCFGPKAVPTPTWNPESAADNCLAQYDTNKDGALDKKEYTASPALASAAAYLDTDADKKLSRAEVLSRIQLYQQTNVNKQTMIRVFVNGVPATDVEVEFVPEDFLKEFIMPARGMPVPGSTDGVVVMSTEGLPEVVQVGLYRVKVTSPTININPEFNESTKLGLEVSPVTVQGQAGLQEFQVKGKR